MLLMLVVLGCSGDPVATDPADQIMPLGTWSRTQAYADGGGDRRLVSTVIISSQTTGILRDSFFVRGTDAWTFDSLAEVDLRFSSVGDGYLHTTEVDRRHSDTTVRYWYFFKRGDSLYYYRGMRFLGRNVGLDGIWGSDVSDSLIDGRSYSLAFSHGELTYGSVGDGVSATVKYGYSVAGDTLSLHGGALPFGDRYEVFPGWSLYITNHAFGYARRS
jgi:hypothetical protein